jgi:hypothetical protein
MRSFASVIARGLLAACSLVVVGSVFASTAEAQQCNGRGFRNGLCQRHYAGPDTSDLFRQYYADPGACGIVGAELYPSPLPVPAHVGHTYYTYQPMYPHMWMDPHVTATRGSLVISHTGIGQRLPHVHPRWPVIGRGDRFHSLR